ncbi:MAG TPA: dUTP diphosphatase [Actinomycetota bacterium]|jgi:dUTP pyrophosphatase|nr:dUTP diphosphatase [Actinomycetota bacterium]
MATLRLEIKRLDPDLPLPAYQHDDDAGLDLHAAEAIKLAPGERAVVGTGVAVAIPPGYVGLTAPRSGTAARAGLSMVNAPGVIDSGYRGELKLILVNLDPHEALAIERGERVAQLLVVPVSSAQVTEVEELSSTDRGDAGLGSTGS